jgi:hypothetical protein
MPPNTCFNHFARSTQKTQLLLLRRRVYSSVAWQWMSYWARTLVREYVYRVVA